MALLGLDSGPKRTVFVAYMALWSALRMIIYGSKQKGSVKYNQTSLLVFVCVAKLAIALAMYLRDDGGFAKLAEQVRGSGRLFLRYFPPALSYVIYDNLTFVNLAYSDPVTYVILMQMRICATGLMWQAFFSRPLNRNQWLAILVLTVACTVQKGKDILAAWDKTSGTQASVLVSVGFIGFQIACGVFSSVFNELLLKEKGAVSVNLQNMFMYTHSIACNLAWLALCPRKEWCAGDLSEALSAAELGKLLNPWVLPIGCILASIGIVTSLFLKYLDSVRKTIASAMEIFVDALLAWLLFGLPFGLNTAAACCLCSFGVMLYSRAAPIYVPFCCVAPPAGDAPAAAPEAAPGSAVVTPTLGPAAGSGAAGGNRPDA